MTGNESPNGAPHDETRLKTRVDGATATVVLNRPNQRNALDAQTIAELAETFEAVHQKRAIRAVILTGAGSAFCSGLDLVEMHAVRQSGEAIERWGRDAAAAKELFEQLLRFPKPVVAAVNGPAAGAGVGLIAACDVAVGCSAAEVSMPEGQRGLAPGASAAQLVFRIGGAAAARLLLTSEVFSAEESRRIGLFAEVVHQDVVWARAMEIADRAATAAPQALQQTKQLLNETIGESYCTALSAGAAASAASRTTESAAEGLAAFVEKREPRWP